MDHAFIPKLMIFGEIRPVIKSNVLSKNDSENYRPVMNSTMALKVLEYSILPIMHRFLKLSNRQFGFRKDTSCLSAISIVKETIFKYNAEKSNVFGALVDCSKAFDKINKNILFRKLIKSGMDPRFVRLLKCIYDNSYVNTRFNGVNSDSWKVGNGVRQGGILSPLLFGFYIDSVLEEISGMSEGCDLFGYKSNVICYADDFLLLAPSASGLQILINTFEKRINSLCLKVNALKSNSIVFRSNKSGEGGQYNVTLGGFRLTQVNSCKYLGIILCDNGDLGMDLDRVINSFLKQFNGMFAKFKFSSQEVLSYLFRTFTSSFYGIDLWVEKLKTSQLSKISVCYHKAIKRVARMNVWESNHEACDKIGVPIFKHLFAKRLACFWHKLSKTKSPCLANLRYYFAVKSHLTGKIVKYIWENYDVNVSNNPLCAVLARINFIEKNEPRSNYVVSSCS